MNQTNKQTMIIVIAVGIAATAIIGTIASSQNTEVQISAPRGNIIIQDDGLTSAERAVLAAIEEDKRITAMYEEEYGTDYEDSYVTDYTDPMVEYWERAKVVQTLP